MKKIFLFFSLLFFFSIPAIAQNTLQYSHDAAGNRAKRMVRHVAPRPSSLVIDSVLSPISFVPMASFPSVGDSAAVPGDPLSTHNGILTEIAYQDSISALFPQMPEHQLSNYAVGAIPLEEGVSPTGAKTYSLTIPAAPGFDYIPSVSLVYNSQGGNDVAGYGWSLSGVSSVSRTNKNHHFNGEVVAANAVTGTGSYALNGDPLLVNTEENLISSYSLMSFRGKVAMNPLASSGSVIKFNAAYPTGETAVFGTASNTTKMAVFPILESQDVNGNKIEYEYYEDVNSDGTECYIKSIKYGSKVLGNYTAHIDFIYENRTDWHDLFFAGRKFLKKRLLKSVESYSNDLLLVRYNLTHELKDGVSLLKRIDCESSNGEQLPPIDFTYISNDESHTLDSLFCQKAINLSSYFAPARYTNRSGTGRLPDKDLVFLRGKFTTGSFDDGIVLYPATSLSSTNKEIIFLRYKRDLFSQDRFTPVSDSLYAGDGFLGMMAIDIDGDGTDELIKLNSVVSGSNTKVNITVFDFCQSGSSYSSRSYTIPIGGRIDSDNPRPVYFRSGDFIGKGRTTLVLLTAKEAGTKTFSDSHIKLIDLETGSVSISQSEVIHEEEIDRIICADINSDGRYELCRFNEYGTQMNVYARSSNSFVLKNTFSFGLNVYSGGGPYLADFNGDGYLDIMVPPEAGSTSPTWRFVCFTGNDYKYHYINITTIPEGDRVYFYDINHDGLSDILIHGNGIITYLINNQSNETVSFSSGVYRPFVRNNPFDIVPCSIGDVTGVSCPAVIRNGNLQFLGYTGDAIERRLLSRIKDSYGNINTLRFKSMALSEVYQTDTARVYNPNDYVAKFSLPLFLLAGDYTVSSGQRVKDKRYTYYDAAFGTTGLGFLGFGKIRTQDEISHVTLVNTYLPEKNGVLQNSDASISFYEDGKVSSVSNEYDNHTERGILLPRLTGTTETDHLTGITSESSIEYDTRDFQKNKTTHSWGNSTSTDTLTVVSETLYIHKSSSSLYLLGSPLMVSSRKGNGSNPARLWEERSVFWRDAKMRPTKQKTYVGWDTTPTEIVLLRFITYELSPDVLQEILGRANNLRLETQWTYTPKGKVKTKKSANYGSSTLVGETYTYDFIGQFLSTKKDALNQTTTYLNYDRWGKPSRINDPRGNNTYYSYDSWGQLVSVQTPDGGQKLESKQWDSTVNNGLIKITVSETGTPDKVSYTDALGREIRSGSRTSSGSWRLVDKIYQRNGLLFKESLPFTSADNILWHTYYYDAYRRLAEELHPGGGRTTYSYNGTSVKTIRDSLESIRTTDAWGRLVNSSDAGGTVSYVLLEHDGPSEIIAPGGISTTFTYDGYGRRNSINDPSAGSVTDSWTNQPLGVVAHASTNALGTITQNEDKLGRIFSIVRSDGNTSTFNYDSYGKLTKATTKGTQNDTLHVQKNQYDTFGRLSKVTETQYDAGSIGYQLETEFTYGTGSVLRSKKYSVGNTVLATENYRYSNGHLISIKLSDSTVVWSLEAENALGQATRERSGNVLTESAFTGAGLPVTKKMGGGAIQNLSYSFDASTSNMTSRADAGRQLSESFSYDALNRLRAIGQQEIKYDNAGNIKKIDGVATMSYPDDDNPYWLVQATPAATGIIPNQTQTLSFTSFSRPKTISQGSWKADLDYGEADERTVMHLRDADSTIVMTRLYAQSASYERDITSSGTTERLYLGGDAYDAPMVLVKNNSVTNLYVIGRDVLGSITHLCTPSGSLVAEYSYDAWGRIRNPQNLQLYAPGQEPALLLSRGWTGHEWLPWFGLYNANARLFDPYIARFLSPDPFVQTPDFTQNFNRYLYGYGNPLKYVDKDGKIVWFIPIIIGAAIGAYSGGVIANKGEFNPFKWDYKATWPYIVGGAFIGAVSSGVGMFATSAVSSTLSFGGFWGGAISSAAGGFSSGFISGFGMSALAGENFLSSLKTGFFSALYGSFSSAIIGGIFQGYSDWKKGNSFWNGEVKLSTKDIDFQLSRQNSEINSPKIKHPQGIYDNYSFESSPDESVVTLYRRLSGSEYENGKLFMTDNYDYALSYGVKGSPVVKVEIPKSTLELMMQRQDLSTILGLNVMSNDFGIKGTGYLEFIFSNRVKSEIVNRFIYIK